MTKSINVSASPELPESVLIPQDGDDATASSGSSGAPVEDVFQSLLDGIAAGFPDGYRASSVRARSTGGTTCDVDDVLVIGMRRRAHILTGTVDLEEAYGGALPADTWLYLCYGTTDSAWKLVADPPASGLRYGEGDASSAVYICAIRTNGSGTVVPFEKVGNRVTYFGQADPDLAAASGGCVVRTTAATSGAAWEDVNAAARIPPHARTADVYLVAVWTAGAIAYIRTKGRASTELSFVRGAAEATQMRMDWSLDSDRVLQVKTSSSHAAIGVAVAGYLEGA